MTKKTRFVILNDTSCKIDFEIEPECWPFSLEVGESVTVISEHIEEPATVQLADDPNGGVCAAIIPGDGDVVVEKNGRNVLDGIV